MTHSELAKALRLARSTVTRDVAAGMPLDIRGAKEWRAEHKNISGEKTGPKTQREDESEKQGLPNWLRQEHRERLLSKQIQDLMWTNPRTANQDAQLAALRTKYELLADAVLNDHVDLIESAFNRRLFTSGGFTANEAPEKYVNALSEIVERWQEILDADDAECLPLDNHDNVVLVSESDYL
jgi:hypothetical protein